MVRYDFLISGSGGARVRYGKAGWEGRVAGGARVSAAADLPASVAGDDDALDDAAGAGCARPSWAFLAAAGTCSWRPFGESPVQYREGPLEYEPAVLCRCGVKMGRFVSWRDFPGRRFYCCMDSESCDGFTLDMCWLSKFVIQAVECLNENERKEVKRLSFETFLHLTLSSTCKPSALGWLISVSEVKEDQNQTWLDMHGNMVFFDL
uniref:Zinc finger GRF-type domain-containing protein n=1 Tax=Leersia perrieri TaxID=77586 RepID=A0A0D9VEP1_9ORYZ